MGRGRGRPPKAKAEGDGPVREKVGKVTASVEEAEMTEETPLAESQVVKKGRGRPKVVAEIKDTDDGEGEELVGEKVRKVTAPVEEEKIVKESSLAESQVAKKGRGRPKVVAEVKDNDGEREEPKEKEKPAVAKRGRGRPPGSTNKK